MDVSIDSFVMVLSLTKKLVSSQPWTYMTVPHASCQSRYRIEGLCIVICSVLLPCMSYMHASTVVRMLGLSRRSFPTGTHTLPENQCQAPNAHNFRFDVRQLFDRTSKVQWFPKSCADPLQTHACLSCATPGMSSAGLACSLPNRVHDLRSVGVSQHCLFSNCILKTFR